MAFQTTSIQLSTTPTVLISTGTTWANILQGSAADTTPFAIKNPSTQIVYLVGSLTASTVDLGYPVLPNENFVFDLYASDALFGITSASTVTVNLLAGRQNS